MKNRPFLKGNYGFIPLLFCGLLCIALIFLLWNRHVQSEAFSLTLEALIITILSISGLLALAIMTYLVLIALSIKKTRNTAIEHLSAVTQKMHHFRNIVELLFRSKMWLPGLKEYIDEEFEGLNFFEVKEFYKGRSKLAIEFLQEQHNYQDTENLYLELKSLLMTSPRDKNIPENIHYPKVYDQEIVTKWLEHKCGSGLWYYFGYKYGIFKEALDLNTVYERHQDKIMTLANTIDSEVFEDSSFNEVFLSKLGEYMTNEVIPKLFQFQEQTGKHMPGMFRYLYGIFLLLGIFGVLLPLLYLLFSLPLMALIVSYSMIISTVFFILITLYEFLSSEVQK